MGAFLIYSVGAWLGRVWFGQSVAQVERGSGRAWLARSGLRRGAFRIYSDKAWLG